jgi:murein endopeptidase
MAPRRDRVWGTRGTIEHIQEAAATVARQYPGTVPLFIGDVSFARGGFMPPHKSHRGGNDVDISYFKKDNDPGTHFESVSAKTMDAEKNWAFIAALLDSGHVTAIYIDRRLHKPLRDAAAKMGYDEETLTRLFETRGYDKGASRTAVIRHIRGHGDHMHVRFDCPKGDHPSS